MANLNTTPAQIEAAANGFLTLKQTVEEQGTAIQDVNEFKNLIADYIINTGESGNWKYVKYNSGMMICWGTHPVSVSFPVKTSSVQITNNVEIETPMLYPEHAMPSVSEPWCVANYVGANNRNIRLRIMYVDVGDVGQKSMNVYVSVIGRWK